MYEQIIPYYVTYCILYLLDITGYFLRIKVSDVMDEQAVSRPRRI